MCSKVTHSSLHVARAVTTEAHFLHTCSMLVFVTLKKEMMRAVCSMFGSTSVLSFKHCLDLNLRGTNLCSIHTTMTREIHLHSAAMQRERVTSHTASMAA